MSEADSNVDQPIAALLTSTSRAAVAVVAVWHPNPSQLDQCLAQLFSPIGSRSLMQLPNRSLIYGVWNSSEEDLVIVRKPDGMREIHCHGGQVAVAAVLDSLRQSKFDILPANEFLGCVQSRWMTETQSALSHAPTQKTASAILRLAQQQPRQLDQWMREMEKIIANSVEPADDEINSECDPILQSTIQSLRDALKHESFGQHLTRPQTVVLCGKPNVGKSSLINRIVGFDRAIVNEQAGTTRDVISQPTAIDGWPVELLDTAGIRDAQNEIESIGVTKAIVAVKAADVRIAVFSVADPFGPDDANLIEQINPDLVVFNKSDQWNETNQSETVDSSPRPEGLVISAATGDNLDLLLEKIACCLCPEKPAENCWFPVTQWQADRLKSTLESLERKDFTRAVNLLSGR